MEIKTLYRMPAKICRDSNTACCFFVDFNQFNMWKYFQEDSTKIENTVMMPLIATFFDNEKSDITECSAELAKIWFDRFYSLFPKYQYNSRNISYFSEVMHKLYHIIKKQWHEEIEKAKHFHENPEVKTLGIQCIHIMEYTEALGKDFFKNGELIGKYLFKKDKNFKFESTSSDGVIKFNKLEVHIEKNCIHHFFFQQLATYDYNLNLMKEQSQEINDKIKKYTEPFSEPTKLDLTTRIDFMKKLIEDGKPEYLEIIEDERIIDWKTRIQYLDLEANQEMDFLGRKKIYKKSYRNWMAKTVNEYKTFLQGKLLKNVYKPDDIIENTLTKEIKTWEKWYATFLGLSKEGASRGLNDLFKALKKVETTSVKAGK